MARNFCREFHTVFSPPVKPFSTAGKKNRPNYKPSYLDSGSYELVEDGVIHSYDDIQAHLPECDLGKIIDLYMRSGDSSLIERRAGFFDEVGILPSNYVELQNVLKRSDVLFNSLPVEIKEKYGNSAAKFFNDKDNIKFLSDFYNPKASVKVEPVKVEPVKVPEVKVGVEDVSKSE